MEATAVKFCKFQTTIMEVFHIHSWACIWVLLVFVSCLRLFPNFYMMSVKFFMYEILTAPGNLYNIFLYNLQNMNAANFLSIFEKLSMQHVKFSMHISKYYVQSKFCNLDKFIRFMNFVLCTLKGFIGNIFFSLGKVDRFSNLFSECLIEKYWMKTLEAQN